LLCKYLWIHGFARNFRTFSNCDWVLLLLFRSGISVVGRDYYGVFPLKGKPLNVREATHAQIMKNDEIKNVVEILGLKFGEHYDESNIKTLRYGHLMIMADQDHDGSHIKGLVINFIHRKCKICKLLTFNKINFSICSFPLPYRLLA